MFITDRKTMMAAETLAAEREGWFGLMQNAGRAAAEYIINATPTEGKTALLLCGKGNNGGDGFIIAEALLLSGAEVTVLLTHGLPATDSAQKAFALLSDGVRVTDLSSFDSSKPFDLVVDAVFGTGANGKELDPELAGLFAKIGRSDFAVDVPSGLSCDTAEGAEFALPSKTTLTFGAPKLCHLLPRGREISGHVETLNIGITEEDFEKSGAFIREIAPATTEKRRPTCHKNDFGTLLSVCGSYGMSGASIIAGKAALRSGVGILKQACVEENYLPCAVTLPEAVLLPCKTEGKTYGKASLPALKEALSSADALLMGCGMGVSDSAKSVVEELLKTTKVPTVLDADGINMVASDIELLKDVKAPLILTPHPGEMARLLSVSPANIEKNRFETAKNFAQNYGVILVLKGANTVVADPKGNLFVCTKGNSGMATAGSGDMLAGIIAALLAKGKDPLSAALDGVWLHSAAGDVTAEELGEEAMLPTDMIDRLHRFL